MRTKGLLSLCFSLLILYQANANNIQISSLSLSGQNTTLDFTMINFGVSWNNSWRINVGPSNWDAAWIFAKYRLKTSTDWKHATLNYVDGTGANDGHTVPAGATIASSNDNGAGGAVGVFLFSNSIIAQQNVNYTGARLRWNYGVDGLADADSVEICVYAIEMVYVPEAGFFVGDGNAVINGQFRVQASNTPFQITSEASLTLGGGGVSALHNNNAVGQTGADDFNNTTSQTLAASYPKGFNAFYTMKYEISQEQYVAFLNKINRTQQASRFVSIIVGNYMHSGSGQTTPQNRNGVRLMSDPGGVDPRVYGNDLSNNNIAGEANDGQNIACNWLSMPDLLAYLDWAGLRPMTELEYEKACRGTAAAVAGEFAWGSTSILGSTGITNSGAANEISNNNGNCTYNNSPGVSGPMRSGCYAQTATSRIQAGAAYYGLMEMSGNVWDPVVPLGSVAGRSFTGLHGNGVLHSNGNADVHFWPGLNGNNTPANPNGTTIGVGCAGWAGISFTGGAWNSAQWLTISNREYRGSGWASAGRDNRNGGRGVRTEP